MTSSTGPASATRSPSTSSTTRPKMNCGSGSTFASCWTISRSKSRACESSTSTCSTSCWTTSRAATCSTRRSRCSGRRATRRSLRPCQDRWTRTSLPPASPRLPKPEQHDLVIVSGVGSVWPLLRSHTLLNNLHPIMGKTPLVMFYPGRYDGQSLRLVRQAEKHELLPSLQAGSVERPNSC